ncbi:hypothetical protein KIS4809_4641 [Bacillus sp. ZZV12-4809]|nr:hypothetical protein KIS4809_4641 [Bacillus sp. ZZV12-4809]
MNIAIELKNHNGHMGHGYRALTAKDSAGNQLLVDINGANVVNFIEGAVQAGVRKLIANGGAAEAFNVSLTGITLTAGAQTMLVDKLTSDPLISSLAFA